jgi:hypothetical protein
MQLNHWTFLVEICYRFDLRKGTILLISNKAIIEYTYDSYNKHDFQIHQNRQRNASSVCDMLQSLNWYSIEDRRKDDRRIMHGTCIYNRNEQVANMYYLKKQSRHMHSFIFTPCKTQERHKLFPSYDSWLEAAATGHSFELYCSINNWIRHTFHNLKTFSLIYTFKTVGRLFFPVLID